MTFTTSITNHLSLTGNPQSDSFIIPFKNLINDAYCKDISVKVRSSLTVKQKNGEFVGSFAPYGYKKADNDKNHLIVDEDVREIIQTVFSMYKDGFSIGRIADRLNQMGVLSPMEYKRSQGLKFDTVFKRDDTARWSYKAIQRILTNEVYIGVLAQGKRGRPTHKVRTVQKRDESEWIKVENAHEALISHDDFMIVQTMMKRDMRCGADQEEVSTLSGFLFCGDCGRSMIRKTVPSKKKKYLERLAYQAIIQVVSLSEKQTTRNKQAAAKKMNVVSGYMSQLRVLQRQEQQLKSEKFRSYERFTAGSLSKTEYMRQKSETDKRLAKITEAIKQHQDQLCSLEQKQPSTDKQVEIPCLQFVKSDHLTPELAKAFIKAIYIHTSDRIEIEWRFKDVFQLPQNVCYR